MKLLFLLICLLYYARFVVTDGSEARKWEGKVVKGNRNALFLIRKGQRHMFPDFYTFSHMGFNVSAIEKIPDDILSTIPLGDNVQPIPVFRPEDYMYHKQCDDPHRMVNDLGVVANLGNMLRFSTIHRRVQRSKSIEVLFLGGSITAGGYFMEFLRLLRAQSGLNVTYHNHGHGATEITYSIFCVDIEKYKPDIVLIDFSVNDYGHPKLMETLLRKALSLPSKPVVTLVNLWVHASCPVTKYLIHSFYYQIPVLNVCPAVNLCYGKDHLPRQIWEQYSRTDGVHPWGVKGVPFLGELLYAWWKRLENMITNDVILDTDGRMHQNPVGFDHLLDSPAADQSWQILPPPLYSNSIGLCTRCVALSDDADGKLTPITAPNGFRMITRVKVGYGGFGNSDSSGATKSFKRSWQADKVGAQIAFRFYGSSVALAIWQRRDGMGILDAHIDDDRKNGKKVSGFFKGYTWAMEKNNTGRSEIVPLFEGLKDGFHTLTLTVSDKPANPWVPGHITQIFALLSASDDLTCKQKQ